MWKGGMHQLSNSLLRARAAPDVSGSPLFRKTNWLILRENDKRY